MCKPALSMSALAILTLGALTGCGTAEAPRATSTRETSEPAYAAAPFTHQQELVEAGATLDVADGCSACHAIGGKPKSGPSFTGFAGRHLTLADGRRALVDERFLRAALQQPGRLRMRGYAAAPMIAAVRRARLSTDPKGIAELAAFIEQVGPEAP
jgi:cytochrome c551/c552